MNSPRRDPSIEHEPQFQQRPPEGDPSEAKADATLRRESSRQKEIDAVEHTVWDEPALAEQVVGAAPEGQLTYARWMDRKIRETSWRFSWLVTLGVVFLAGPWGVVGALLESVQGSGPGDHLGVVGLVAVVIVGPVTEEIMKIAIALWIVEKRPYWFKSILQLLICAVAGGIVFAIIENLMYLLVYIPDHTANLARWRWTACVGLHVNCSFVAGIGLARIWSNAVRERHRPRLGLGMPWFFTAMVGHGLYNLGAVVGERAGWLDF